MSTQPELEPTLTPSRQVETVEPTTALPALDETRYRVEDRADALLGRGGQGAVWRARDEVLRREVALKRLHLTPSPDAVAESAFMREARLTALLEHPGIVPVHDVGRAADGAATLVMRRIEGESLAEKLAHTRDLDARLALVPALLRACQTVAFAHEHHVVHRDLKPQNVMLGAFGEAYVLDWGLGVVEAQAGASVDITAPASTSGVVGTPAYMSPEQALGLAADARSDVWGLGACLYQLLTGEPPLGGSSVQSTVRHAAAGEVSPVRALAPGAPPDLVAICEKALAPARGDRYPSALELARDLEAWLAGRTVSARALPLREALWRALKAHRAMVTVVSIATVVLGLGLAVDELRVRRERDEARSFARELLRDVPAQVDTQRPNIALLSLLSSRAQQWLERSDFSGDERAEACAMLNQLATLHFDTQQWAESDRLSAKALELARSGRAGDARAVACEGTALALLGDTALELGRVDEGLARFLEAETKLEAWRGSPSAGVTLARARVQHSWGDWLWTRSPREGAAHFIKASELALTVLDDPASRASALGYAFNGCIAQWSQGHRREARELARRFWDAARPLCEQDDTAALKSCLPALTSYFVFLSWDDDPEARALELRAKAIDEQLRARNKDSATTRYDSMIFALDRGDFAAASGLATGLRDEVPSWVLETGPLSAVLAGDLEAFDAWRPLLDEGKTGAPLALGLREAAPGNFAAAAAQVRAVERDRLWAELSWPAHPRVTLKLDPAAQPALDTFLAEFTAAYGAADAQRLSDALDTFAAALDAVK